MRIDIAFTLTRQKKQTLSKENAISKVNSFKRWRSVILVWTAKRFPKTLTSQLLKHDPQQGWKFNTRLTLALKQAS